MGKSLKLGYDTIKTIFAFGNFYNRVAFFFVSKRRKQPIIGKGYGYRLQREYSLGNNPT